MEKKLLLLGALRIHEMHGYQLNEMLGGNVGLSIKLTKPNAYKLLNKMEQDEWVTFRTEQEGNRPPRRVYKVTDKGEDAFQQMLRDSLATYSVPEFPSTVIYNFLELLPSDEVVALLQTRRETVFAHFKELADTSGAVREKHLGVEYLVRFLQTELEWIDGLIVKFQNT